MSKTPKKCCNSLDEAVLSIALEQTAIAHILNAEGEKIQKGIATAICCDELLCLNESVQNTIVDVTNLEIVLYNKLRKALCFDCNPEICENGEICIRASFCCSEKPFMNAVIQVFCGKNLIAEGKTDECGQFCLGELENGKYEVVAINPMTSEKIVKKCCIDENNKHCEEDICFSNTAEKKIKITGTVVDSRGNNLCKALVIAKGLSEKRVQTDNSGYFEIKDLTVSETFSIFATYAGKASDVSKRTHPVLEDYFFTVKIVI